MRGLEKILHQVKKNKIDTPVLKREKNVPCISCVLWVSACLVVE